MSVHVQYICLTVGHTGQPCKSDWTVRNAVWRETNVGPRNRVLDRITLAPPDDTRDGDAVLRRVTLTTCWVLNIVSGRHEILAKVR